MSINKSVGFLTLGSLIGAIYFGGYTGSHQREIHGQLVEKYNLDRIVEIQSVIHSSGKERPELVNEYDNLTSQPGFSELVSQHRDAGFMDLVYGELALGSAFMFIFGGSIVWSSRKREGD